MLDSTKVIWINHLLDCRPGSLYWKRTLSNYILTLHKKNIKSSMIGGVSADSILDYSYHEHNWSNITCVDFHGQHHQITQLICNICREPHMLSFKSTLIYMLKMVSFFRKSSSNWHTVLFSYRFLQRLVRTSVILVLLLYLVVPVFVKTNPWIQTKIIFLNNCKYDGHCWTKHRDNVYNLTRLT